MKTPPSRPQRKTGKAGFRSARQFPRTKEEDALLGRFRISRRKVRTALSGYVESIIPARMLNEFAYCRRLFYHEFVESVFVERLPAGISREVARTDRAVACPRVVRNAGMPLNGAAPNW